jgi:hypothetical protein
MPEPVWSVRLVNNEQDRRIAWEHRSVWPGLRRTTWLLGEDGEPDTTTFELEATDAKTARARGLDEMAEMRRRAGVPDGPDGVIWVVPLADEAESSLRFREYAKDALDAEEYDLAVATIQIHLEVHVRVLVELIAKTQPSRLIEAVTRRQQRWAPHERWLRPVLEALLEVRLDTCPVWGDYKDRHLPRRNAVVHMGQEIDADSARASIDTVSELWLWLNDAATKATGSG